MLILGFNGLVKRLGGVDFSSWFTSSVLARGGSGLSSTDSKSTLGLVGAITPSSFFLIGNSCFFGCPEKRGFTSSFLGASFATSYGDSFSTSTTLLEEITISSFFWMGKAETRGLGFTRGSYLGYALKASGIWSFLGASSTCFTGCFITGASFLTSSCFGIVVSVTFGVGSLSLFFAKGFLEASFWISP
jgi:hypothetical protein